MADAHPGRFLLTAARALDLDDEAMAEFVGDAAHRVLTGNRG